MKILDSKIRALRMALIFATTASLLLQNSPAKAGEKPHVLLVKACRFLLDVHRTQGRRLFSSVDERKPLPGPYAPWLSPSNSAESENGIVEKQFQKGVRQMTRDLPGGPYEAHFFRGVAQKTWGRYTEKKFGVRERPSFLTKAATSFLLSSITLGIIFQKADHIEAHKWHNDVRTNAALYDYFVDHDFRCAEIKARLNDGLESREDARDDAFYQVRVPYAQWFANRPFYINGSMQSLKTTLINFSLFHSLKDIVENGVRATDGFRIPPESMGPLSDLKIRRLFEELDELAIKQEWITRLVVTPYFLEKDISPGLFTDRIKSEVLNNPMNTEPLALYNSKEISREQLLYWLEENEFQNTQFNLFQILGITPLYRASQDSPYTNRPLDKAEVQQEIKTDVFKGRGR